MKIASVYPFRAFPPRGGNHLHAYQIVRQFLLAGHEVFTLGDDSVSGVTAFPRDREGVAKLCAVADVMYVRIDSGHIGRDPVLLHLLETCNKPLVWEINAPSNENLAFSWLGGASQQSLSPLQRVTNRIKRQIHAWRQYPGILREEKLRRRLARRALGATCVSAGVAKYAREGLGIADARVVPNAGDPDTHRPDGPTASLPSEWNGCLKVLYAGSPIYPWQGLDVVAEAMRMCAAANDPVRFIFLMNQAPPQPIDTTRALVQIGVPYERVGDYVRAADVAVVAHPEFFWSPWGSHGSPMKVFDYMSCGRPVVASRVGQLAELIQDNRNGLLFDNSAADLRRCLLKLAQQRSELAAMGSAARHDIETRYNWRQVGRATLDLLQETITR